MVQSQKYYFPGYDNNNVILYILGWEFFEIPNSIYKLPDFFKTFEFSEFDGTNVLLHKDFFVGSEIQQ